MSAKPTALKIDFVSDIACPWCAVGLASLQQALKNSADAVQATIHFQPFELNPDMPPEGEDVDEHLARKYGGSPAQFAQHVEAAGQRRAALPRHLRAVLDGRPVGPRVAGGHAPLP